VSANAVIASEAKQSISSRRERMDCFVANASRNDEGAPLFRFRSSSALFLMDCRVIWR